MNKIYVSDNYIVVDIDGELSMFPKNRSEYDESTDSFTLRKYPNKQIQIFSFKDVGDWFDIDGVVPFTIELLRTFLRQNTGFNTASGGSGAANVPITQSVDGYSNFANGTEVGEIGYSKISEGTRWLPGTIGGTYYPAGFYVWDGNVWVSDRNAIAEQFNANIESIQTIETKLIDSEVVIKQASDFPSPVDPTKVYVIDFRIDMGSTPIVVGAGGFFYKGVDYFVSSLYSTADNYTMFVNEAGQPAGNIRGTNVEHYVTGLNSEIFDLDNQGNSGAIEFNSCNFGRFASETTSLGQLSNFRQFRTNDCGFFRIADGLTFNGTWAGGFRIGDSILLSIPAGVELFKEGTNLIFEGSSFSDLNAIDVDDASSVFGFTENNFLLDEGFKTNDIRFNRNSNPIPNADLSSSKFNFKGRGIKNTFPGGRWEITNQTVTPLDQGVKIKALGTTDYDDLVHFTNSENNAFVYDSNIEKDFIVTGQIVVDGGANDEIEIFIDKWDEETQTLITQRSFKRNVSNVLGGLDIAIFDPYTPITLKNRLDRIEVHIRNNSDGTNATLLNGSFLAVNVRN